MKVVFRIKVKFICNQSSEIHITNDLFNSSVNYTLTLPFTFSYQCLSCIFHSNLIFVSLPDESSRMLLKRRTLFFGLTDADMRETDNVNDLFFK